MVIHGVSRLSTGGGDIKEATKGSLFHYYLPFVESLAGLSSCSSSLVSKAGYDRVLEPKINWPSSFRNLPLWRGIQLALNLCCNSWLVFFSCKSLNQCQEEGSDEHESFCTGYKTSIRAWDSVMHLLGVNRNKLRSRKTPASLLFDMHRCLGV